MALVVGDLLDDTDAQSFISEADADAYLSPENNTAWEAATTADREAALVVASRWLVASVPWIVTYLDADAQVRVGRATARIAVEALSRDLMAAVDRQSQVRSESVGPVSVEYRDTRSGLAFPWLRQMLAGLVMTGGSAAVPVVRA